MAAMAASPSSAGGTKSFAGAAPSNADELQPRTSPTTTLPPPAPAGDVAPFNLVLTDRTIEIAPGVKYSAWTWAAGRRGRCCTCARARP